MRTGDGNMVPLGTLATVTATAGPDVIYRYNRSRAVQLLGGPAPGYSSGQAVAAMEDVAASALPSGYGYEWTGTTYQEKEAQGHEGVIFGFAAVLVFLFLAALYESWSIPFAVLLAVPLGLFGALFAVWVRAYPYDIYTQIGIVTLIGLAAKNAILIVEFARTRYEGGQSIREAAMEAARLRLRPILMTSFAFILGVTPLLIAKGAGAASRRSLGTAVFGGMNAATLLAIFIVPVLFFVIQNMAAKKTSPAAGAEPVTEPVRMKHFLYFLPLALSVGCRVGPNYKRPAVPLPVEFRGETAPASAASLAETKWPDLFQDAALKQLIATALAQNLDLTAGRRARGAGAGAIPHHRGGPVSFPVCAGPVHRKPALRGRLQCLGAARSVAGFSYTQAGAALSWELDLWGRLRRLTESARAQYLATEEARHGVIVSLDRRRSRRLVHSARARSGIGNRALLRAISRRATWNWCASATITAPSRRSTFTRPSNSCISPPPRSPAPNATSARRRMR